jgi:hypothetical protein
MAYSSSGLVCYYVRPLAAAAALSLATQTVTGAHSDGGFVEVSSANMPGVYRLDLSDAVCAAGVPSVLIMLKGAANMVPVLIEIKLSIAADVVSISGDAAAADNAESMFDGTGYAGGTTKLGVNLIQILGTTLTETAGQIAAAFKKFFDKAAPTGTINSIPDAVAGAAGGLFIAGTNAPTVVTTALTATFTGNLTGSVASVAGAVGSVTGLTPATVHGDLDDIQARLPAALVGGRMDANAGAISGDAVAADTLELFAEALDQATGQIDNGTLGTALDTYQARIDLYDDDTGAADRYEVSWYKNGEPITSGITSPTIQVIKSADGTNLVASTAMTEIGSLGLYKHVESSNRIVAGATYRAKVQATIGGATRTDFKDVGRDS